MNFSAIHFDTQRRKRHTILCAPQNLNSSRGDFTDSIVCFSSSTLAAFQNGSSITLQRISGEPLSIVTTGSSSIATNSTSSATAVSHFCSSFFENADTIAHHSTTPLAPNESSGARSNETSCSIASSVTSVSSICQVVSSSNDNNTFNEKQHAKPKRCASYSFSLENSSFLSSASNNSGDSSAVIYTDDISADSVAASTLLKEESAKRLLNAENIDLDATKDSISEKSVANTEILTEQLPLIVETMQNLANKFEGAFEYTLNKNFKRKSYGIICIEIANSFQRYFLGQLADFISNKPDLLFSGLEKDKKVLNCNKNRPSESSMLGDFYHDKQAVTQGNSNEKVSNCLKEFNKDWEFDLKENVINILVKNVNLDKTTNEVTIRYFDVDPTTNEAETTPGLWLTTKELHYLLSMSLMYENELIKKLREFWENYTDISFLALSKLERDPDEDSEVIHDDNKKWKRDETQQKQRYGQIQNIYKMEYESLYKKQAMLDVPNSSESKVAEKETEYFCDSSNANIDCMDANKDATVSASLSISKNGIVNDETSQSHVLRSKNFKVVTLADIKNLSVLNLTSPISLSLSDSQLPSFQKPRQIDETAKQLNSVEVYQSKTPQARPPVVAKRSKNKAKVEEIVGLKTLYKLHHKLLGSLQATTAETHMLLELANDLTQGRRI